MIMECIFFGGGDSYYCGNAAEEANNYLGDGFNLGGGSNYEWSGQ